MWDESRKLVVSLDALPFGESPNLLLRLVVIVIILIIMIITGTFWRGFTPKSKKRLTMNSVRRKKKEIKKEQNKKTDNITRICVSFQMIIKSATDYLFYYL